MQTKTYTVYKFDELDEKAKEKAIENLRYINVDHDWSEYTRDHEKEQLEKHGFEGVNILFSGFYSQGDGACFTGTLNTDGLLKYLTHTKQLKKYPKLVRALKKDRLYVNIKITHTDRYCHENSTTLEDYTEMQDNSELPAPLQKEYDAWYATFDARGPRNESIGWYYDTCRNIYETLEKEHDYYTSDESITETIRANDYDFTSDGVID
jgi:hypothetical protein